MFIRGWLLSLVLGFGLVGFSNSSQAAIVEAGSPAIFSFDVSGEGALTLSAYSYSCPTECPIPGPNGLAAGASFDFDFGSTAGASDLGTDTLTNPFGFALTGAATNLNAPINIPGASSEFFVSILFVDDVFGIEFFNVGGIGFNLSGVLVDQPSAIPLPAALPLFAGGLGLMGLLGWRKKQAATA